MIKQNIKPKKVRIFLENCMQVNIIYILISNQLRWYALNLTVNLTAEFGESL